MHIQGELKPQPIEYLFDPFDTYFYQGRMFFDNDLIFFVDSSASYTLASLSDLTVIGGRFADGLIKAGTKFTKLIGLPKSEEPGLIYALQHANRSTYVIPLKDKILAVNNRLFRACGLGTAFIFNYSPEAASAIIRENYSDIFKDIIFSDSFDNIAAADDRSMDFIVSLSFFSKHLNMTFGEGLPYSVKGFEGIFEMIKSAATIIGCPITINLSSVKDHSSSVNGPFLGAFMLCLLSIARSTSKDRRAAIEVSFDENCLITLDYAVYSNTDHRLSELSLCNSLARNLNIPFKFDIFKDHCHAEFIPFKLDPSLFGLKAGIYIEGMPTDLDLPRS